MKIVIAPDSFKESADAVTVAEAIASGVRRALPRAMIEMCPMADGGQGTVSAMVAATGGQTRAVSVTGPLGEPRRAEFGLLGGSGEGGRAAVVEMAAASGLMLVPPEKRNPLKTTTYGTGQLIAAALGGPPYPDSDPTPNPEPTLRGPRRVDRIIVGIGGSATNDCGAGLAQALGIRFLDGEGRPLAGGLSGGRLDTVARIDPAGRDPRLAEVDVVAACDVSNPLTGPDGASAVYGPQKGATPEMVERLDANLASLAGLIRRDLGIEIESLPGAGAAGGLGGGLVAFCGARLRPGIEIVIEATRLADRLRDADLCITGEGRLDAQSLFGKTAIGVGRLARQLGVPTLAIVGSVGQGAERTLDDCLAAYVPIKPDDMPLAEAMARVKDLLEGTAERVIRERFAGLVG